MEGCKARRHSKLGEQTGVVFQLVDDAQDCIAERSGETVQQEGAAVAGRCGEARQQTKIGSKFTSRIVFQSICFFY